ncbi:MAG: helix-turn-helix domain-containing protein [Lachnospiraceae bacterium]|nr:helix-turn-helix domain-containing protein [Lachnospiraceae bacterium]
MNNESTQKQLLNPEQKNEEITIAYRIKTLREYQGLTQEDLRKAAGYSDKSSISKIENSGNDISLKKVNRIAAALGVTTNELLGDDKTDSRIQVLADAAKKERERIPSELKTMMDEFKNTLESYNKDLETTRGLINKLTEKEKYQNLKENFDETMAELNSKSSLLNKLFADLEKAVNYETTDTQTEET